MAWWLMLTIFVLIGSVPIAAAKTKKVVFLAGKKSHAPGEHEYEKGLRLLAKCLETSPNRKGFRTEVHLNGWPEDPKTFDDADTIVLYCDGSDRSETDDPLLIGDRLEVLGRQMRRGCGLVLLHYATFAPVRRGGPEYLEWVGGFFDYETGSAPNHWYSRIRVAETTAVPATPNHPICRGLTPFRLREEYYYNMRFRANDPRRVPILNTSIPDEPQTQTVAWAVQRQDGGRGFAFTGGHFHSNWQVENFRKMVLNAIVWTAKGDVPKEGVQSLPAPETGASWPKVNARDTVDWPNVGNDKGGTRYSRLTQINRDNVRDLQVAWVYHTGDAAASRSTIECTPVVVEGVMYLTTVQVKVVALDAATGKALWSFDPHTDGVNRGIACWSDGKPNGLRRVLLATNDGRLIALDARTGQPDPGFGKGGSVDLRAGVARDISRMTYGCTSPPMVFEDIAVLGFIVSEGQPGAPGDIRAFDVRTGREIWRFHTVPHPSEFGNDTWEGDGWKERSGTNPWSGFTLDEKRGILFCGTGSAAADFYGADRHGSNLFANCTLALDARTGKRLWHFQQVHHDLWDHDNPCPPTLCTVRQNGKTIDAVAQPTKTGYVFLFDRLTGRPLFDVEEAPAPPSDVPGEQTWPTQPEPVRPPALCPTVFTDADVTDISPEATAYVREMLTKLRYGKPYLPPSLQGTVIAPGFHGGANWSGASFDPTSSLSERLRLS
jgi:quinoprotein glucose dehydrogenase